MSDTTAQLPSSRRKPHSRPIAASTARRADPARLRSRYGGDRS
jgi:hypothetical protein